MKKILIFLMALLMIFTAIGCNNQETETDSSKKGYKTLNGKDSQEIYNSAIDYVKSLKNYEILVSTTYKQTSSGETLEQSHTELHKCSGDSFYYLYESEIYGKEFYLHDGTMLYKSENNVNEKFNISYSDFMQSWGGITSNGMLIALSDAKTKDKLFVLEGEEYYLDFLITQAEYESLTGGEIASPVKYRIYFDKEGTLVHFERTLSFYYDEYTIVDDTTKVYIQAVDQVEKIPAPEYAELYSTRVEAKDIDLSTVESLDIFEDSSEITDYILLNVKVDGSVKISETETVENYEGKILIRLFPDVAPLTVANFQSLVGHSFYNGLTFHRIINSFVIQGGDPNGDGTGGSDEEIFGEFSENGFTNNLSHVRGVVSMARSSYPNTASSQFFICHADATELDGKYASFGYVAYGMDVVDILASLETDSDDKPTLTVKIEKASFVQKKAQ